MDRRIFLKGVLGGGALGATPLAVMADFGARDEARRPVMVVAQAESPQALALARGLAAEQGVRPVAASAQALGSFAGVTALLDRAGRARVVGVMDDASAVIFQQIAAARGAGLVMDTYRRVGTASLVSFAIDA
ncbi:hypothetical protein [Aromatoleum petrolei]|uniref:Uncharacterized protein n=1 Tax=Aromatoleum petrolei TaxID=76116 RepID=A0ABX1MNQ3_9RHOO|nr:hypothetical protein [Aromatoleum petrolei]NMF88258.1 hypothetical protein [Aromatoleum petrolei]QTQ38040.1 Uncharacterized protein ToN1_39360 [Aromatoleum petrolei]